MRALVTGASGLIGANLVRLLEARGDAVRGMVRPESDLRGLAGRSAERVYGDVRVKADLVAACEGVDVLFHTAAVFAYWGVPEAQVRDTAVQGARNAVEAAHEAGVGRVVLTSSSVTCGSSRSRVPRDEDQHIAPDEEAPSYFHAKAAAERAALERASELGVELVLALPCITVGGPDHKPVPSNAHLLDYLADPSRLSFPGGCNVVDVDDVARGHLLLAERGTPGQRYLLGAENWEWTEIFSAVSQLCGTHGPGATVNHTGGLLVASAWELSAALTGRRPPATREQARTIGRYYYYRSDRARLLGYSPRPTRLALARALAWLVASEHVDGRLRRRLRLDPAVHRAREESP